ncbi:transposase family protein [Sphingobium sp.]|uniref:transposase family protein n=1 Tax=Sphingobium sp. TaxID=1912891 RepID=UPI0039C92C20
MQKALRLSLVIPPGFTIVASSVADDGATILIRSSSPTSQCPKCRSVSCCVHSRYRRQISDLPLAGRAVKLMADVRRFRCNAVIPPCIDHDPRAHLRRPIVMMRQG